MATRNLTVILGDQLSTELAGLDGFDPKCDLLWMAENDEEATHVWCHKYRLVAFFSPMRHFRDALRRRRWPIDYHELPSEPRDHAAAKTSFSDRLSLTLERVRPRAVVLTEPGDYRVRQLLQETCQRLEVPIEFRQDRDFYCTPERFESWASGRKSMVLESFYRMMRSEHDILMDGEGKPVGGTWNFDQQNRRAFPRGGPGPIPTAPSFAPDAVTRKVIRMVETRFEDHPGKTDRFDLPVTREQALEYLEDFVSQRLARFGEFQDAMWSGSDFLYHSRLSHSLNLHLLSPREVVEAVVAAYHDGTAPLNAVEGFVRQVIGWREYVRGIYWHTMPEYADRNGLGCDPDQDVPSFFWDGKTDMACVADAMRLLIETAYAHHIQRLMVLGLYAQLLGVHPLAFHRWHMAMYADAIDWVSLPNALGMSQHGDGGMMATKPYCASGNYIHSMSNHCGKCRYHPKRAVGEDACPFTTLYWDFLDRHAETWSNNHRMAMQMKNLERKSREEMVEIRLRAAQLRAGTLGSL